LLSAARHGHLPRGQLAGGQLPLQKGRPCARRLQGQKYETHETLLSAGNPSIK